ncbi:glutaminase GtaA [Talaromyces proteolyticus]|uniref:Glutaminase GtaA n=1 Tax=Talaromyces proteolyticus TaxID=1131652 RepID=A0AAD4KGQ9_9EURO|nr:glutaminase GtaA [Talaromyces proteolyticus]KAH8690740.1 glutaminase GtaA [Talaromyces proteolyticus]
MKPSYILYALGVFLTGVVADSSFTPARPPAIPLAVKSPYLSVWQNAAPQAANGDQEIGGPGNGGYIAGEWSTFWPGQIIGWAGIVRVDGDVYTWLGSPGNPGNTLVNQTAFSYTAMRSIFTLNINDKVEMNVTFLSPAFPDDSLRQSLIYSYLNVDIKSIDGSKHDVQLYADISAEWVSGDRSSIAQWDFGTTGNVAYHTVYRQTQLLFSQTQGHQADWGDWYWSALSGNGLTYQSGQDIVVRGQFQNNGVLLNSSDTNYRAINDDWPVFGFAYKYSSLGSKPKKALFSIGLAQEYAIQFDGASGNVSVPSLWTSYFQDAPAATKFFMNDYRMASSMADAIDAKVYSDSVQASGQDYATYTTLAYRQAFAGLQLCNTPDEPYVFLKEISSDDNIQTVDVIFPMHPILLYTNVTWLKWTLDPLFINQESGQYPHAYSMHDLGSTYPNATGHEYIADEYMPVEECGNMLIMTLGYAQRANDTAYLQQHYKILDQWTQYLIEFSEYPENQISTDDFAGALANQTNLALKGIIGIQAMSKIANLTGNESTGANYSSIAATYLSAWQEHGIESSASPPHTTLAYDDETSYGLLYNLWADKALSLNFVPQSIYDMQSTFYATVFNEYGIYLDTRHTYTKVDWEAFVASIASSDVQSKLFSVIAKWINSTPNAVPLTDWYDAVSGDWEDFAARPVLGGSFALLALP